MKGVSPHWHQRTAPTTTLTLMVTVRVSVILYVQLCITKLVCEVKPRMCSDWKWKRHSSLRVFPLSRNTSFSHVNRNHQHGAAASQLPSGWILTAWRSSLILSHWPTSQSPSSVKEEQLTSLSFWLMSWIEIFNVTSSQSTCVGVQCVNSLSVLWACPRIQQEHSLQHHEKMKWRLWPAFSQQSCGAGWSATQMSRHIK